MQPSDASLERFIFGIFVLVSLWVGVGIGWRWIRQKKSGLRFPKLPPERVRFEEWTASGSSQKTAFTRLARARNCLRITVTDDEVWVRPFFPFNLLAPELDLEHRIPRASITRVQPKEGSLYRTLLLEFQDPAGGAHRLSLNLKDPEGFLRALVSRRESGSG